MQGTKWIAAGAVFVLGVIYLLPLYWMVVGSFQLATNTLRVPPDFYPPNPTLENYVRLLTQTSAPRWFANSVGTAAVAAVGATLTSALAGYVFAVKRFPGSSLLFWCVLAGMTVPVVALIIPQFLVMRDFGWIDTYQGIVAPGLAYPFGVFLMRQFMHTIPHDLFDAAKVDGASELRVIRHLVIPLARPAIGTIAIFAFIGAWNNYIWQVVIINSSDLLTLPVGIAKVGSGYETLDLGLSMAGAVTAFIPMLLVFLLFQSYFTKGLTAGALKG